MPEKQELKFDTNKFVQNILNAQRRPYFIDQFKILFNRSINGNFNMNSYIGPENEADLKKHLAAEKQYGTANIELTNAMYQIYKNPVAEFATDFYSLWQFIGPIFEPSDSYEAQRQIPLIVNKIDSFDGQTQLELLRFIIANDKKLDTTTIKSIHKKIAANENATANDRTEAAEETKDTNICRDTIEFLKNDLSGEMNKDFPDSNKIHTICNYAQRVCKVLENDIFKKRPNGFYSNNDPEYQYIQMIRGEFDINKILSAGAEYVPQIQKSLEERVIAAEKRAEDTEKQLNFAKQEALHDAEKAKKDLETEKQKSARLARDMDLMQNQLSQQDAFIKALKMKMATLKMGVFGNGKDFQAWLAKELEKIY